MNIELLFYRSIAIILFSVISITAFSQKNLVQGTVITKGNDTLSGLIDYRNWSTNPDRISFTDASGNTTVFTPLDLVKLFVKDEVYVGAVVNTENSPTVLGALQELPGYTLDVDTVFLQAVIEGDRSLYFLKNKSGNNNFFIKKDEGYALLFYKRYLVKTGGEIIVAEVKGYINQLIDYLSGIDELSKEIEISEYNWGNLERLFRLYHSQTRGGIRFSRGSEKLKIKTGVFAGATLTGIILRSNYYTNLEKAEYNPSFDFTGGLAVDLVLPRNFGRWSFNNELQWSSWHSYGERIVTIQDGNIYYKWIHDLAFSYVNLNSILRYNRPVGTTVIFFNAGISNGYMVSQKNEMVFERKEFARIETGEDIYIEYIRRYEQAWLVGAGVRYGKFWAEYRQERGNGLSHDTETYSATRINSLWLGYTF